MTFGLSCEFEVEGIFRVVGLGAGNSEICDIFRMGNSVVAETDPYDYVNKSDKL